MNLDDLKKKAQDALGREDATDAGLDKAAQAAKKATGGKYDDKIDAMRSEADKRLGTE
ncbi:antitoxin [Nanchangia anserum]|uniref:Antitoxin n=1 Tax=Nanchangia anserum TaxID=2692125 RepID=A0A8I0GD03_9ACTO|nr:Rv0909 family putative TA system antitoxin [Nanchangia anserum]MBD3689890.1 antitoxin [Nanchangia anserum]QOX82060.1 antitoxin [Nanchangia anserum]